MLELAPGDAAIVRCLARPAVLDAFAAPGDALPLRVAPDELLIIGPGRALAELLAACSSLAELDPHGLVLDGSDAFAVWTLAGAGADQAFARLSAIPVPDARPAFVQGAIGGMPAKAVLEHGRIHFLVFSSLGHDLRERILAACADLEPREAVVR